MTAITKVCTVCGGVYFPGFEDQVYCSEHCVAQLECVYPKPVKYRECHLCGKRFVVKSSLHRYCSPVCQRTHHAGRHSRGKYIIFERDKFTCFYCGKKSYKDDVELHIDHVVPFSKGGRDIAENLVTACVDCNLEKGAGEISVDALKDVRKEVIRRNKAANISNLLNIKCRSDRNG